MAGDPLGRYAEFPPTTRYVDHAGFAWPVFVGLALLIAAAVCPFVWRVVRSRPVAAAKKASITLPSAGRRGFPWWGWLGFSLTAVAWALAWSRFEWFSALQGFTFSPLWFGYILVVNGLTHRRTGSCMLSDRPRFFAALFPVSAFFWWYFEYLNRFVQNWYYAGVEGFTPLEYFLFASLPFSTVLPAVLGTEEYLSSFPRLSAGLDRLPPLCACWLKRAGGGAGVGAIVGLVGVGVWPDFLFPLLWLAPLVVVAALQAYIQGESTVFAGISRGDWRRVCLCALAAVVCGFFWEMWNFWSHAKWIYSVPFVNRFHVFEMPLLGYAGYLPFGLECAVIGAWVSRWADRGPARGRA